MREQNIKVTTTSSFDNIDITEYLEPITAHVVIGMNVFKDFFSGFTDTFGGNSNIYENTLVSMNQQVVSKLKKKASSKGANCIVGLRIDNDEISAQGKSMMMVTATGTPAVADFPEKQFVQLTTNKKLNLLSFDEYLILNKKKEYLEKCEKNKINTRSSDEFWEFIKKNKLSAFAEYVMNNYETSNIEYLDTTTEKSLAQKQNLIEYLSIIEPDISKESLYNKLNSPLSEPIRKGIEDVILKTYLIDYNRLLKLLSNNDFEIQKSTLKICTYQKMNYEYSDIEDLQSIIEFINNNFQARAQITTKKKLLSSKEHEVWICECNQNNFDQVPYCNKCRKDIYGFKRDEIKPNELIDLLLNKIEILTENLKR